MACRTPSTRALRDNIDIPLLNRALRGTYPPGSTVKPLYALAAQKYGILTPSQEEFCGGFFQLPGSSNKYRDDKKHGFLNMRGAISFSCDVYFFRVAWKMGITRMDDFMKPFGYGELTGIDIPGEKAGLYASPEWKKHAFKRPADQVWFPGEAISMGIGQGPITVTPLQQAHFASEIAERGQLIATPHMVSGIRAAGSNEIVKRAVQMMKPLDVATPEQWGVIIDGMVGAVTLPGGTATASITRPLHYTLAGKTGTAQVFTIKQTESTKSSKNMEERRRDHAWFIAFAPVDDPKIAVAVLVENGGFGGSTSAPIAQKVIDAYLVGPDVPADPKKILPPTEGAPPAAATSGAAPAHFTQAPARTAQASATL